MVEEQIKVVILVIDGDAFLPRDKGEVGAKLEDESLQLSNDGGFDILLGVFTVQAEEVEEVRVAENQVWRDAVFELQRGQLLSNNIVWLLADGRAFEKHRPHSALQSTDAPALQAGHFGIKLARQRFLQVYDQPDVTPGQLSTECVD